MVVLVVLSGLEKKVLALKFYVIICTYVFAMVCFTRTKIILLFFVIDNDRMRMWTLMNAFGKKGDKGTLLYQRKMRNVRKQMKINNRGGQIP